VGYVPRLVSRIGGGVEAGIGWASWGMGMVLPAYVATRMAARYAPVIGRAVGRITRS
jgi:hypothetical protein